MDRAAKGISFFRGGTAASQWRVAGGSLGTGAGSLGDAQWGRKRVKPELATVSNISKTPGGRTSLFDAALRAYTTYLVAGKH